MLRQQLNVLREGERWRVAAEENLYLLRVPPCLKEHRRARVPKDMGAGICRHLRWAVLDSNQRPWD